MTNEVDAECEMKVDNEKAIRAIVSGCVVSYASGISDGLIAENDSGTDVAKKIRNELITFLENGEFCNSVQIPALDTSLSKMLERMAIKIAGLHNDVSKHVEGVLYKGQTDYKADICENYKKIGAPQFSPKYDLYKSKGFWNFVCKSSRGFDIVLNELNSI